MLWGWDKINKKWVKVSVDADGKLHLSDDDPFEITQDTPTDLTHLPHGRVIGNGDYAPFALTADHKLQVEIGYEAHAPKHEDEGSDEISIAGLAGESVELAAHKLVSDAHTWNNFELVQAKANQFIVSPLMADYAASQGITLVADRLYAFPYPMARPRTPSEIGIHIKTADAVHSNLRIGIYADNGSCYPGARITNGGVVDISTTGLKTVAYTTQLPKGLLWIVYISDSSVGAVYANDTHQHIIGRNNNLYVQRGHYYKADTYGNLPDPFPAFGAAESDYLAAVGFAFVSND